MSLMKYNYLSNAMFYDYLAVYTTCLYTKKLSHKPYFWSPFYDWEIPKKKTLLILF